MKKLKLFIDTHDKKTGTFPEKIGKEDFCGVLKQYEEACREEGVVIMKAMVNSTEGKMFCVNLAESADNIRRAHEKIGLPFDGITEVSTASPGDIYFDWK